MLKNILKKSANLAGYRISKISEGKDPVIDRDEIFLNILKQCREYSMTSKERMYALYNAVKYVVNSGIEGDFVECGVWRGGSTMLIALTLKELKITDRKIFLYDTFEGMTEPTKEDIGTSNVNEGVNTHQIWEEMQSDDKNDWCLATLPEVKNNMTLTQYPQDNIVYVKGKVEETIPKTISKNIALLRLDTDWYESTKHELINLYPIISKNGVLIIDDYGAWAGSKKAVDEYFNDKNILLNRIDHTGRIGLKTN